jgi:tetratricopeptide (TPR) repeat protein
MPRLVRILTITALFCLGLAAAASAADQTVDLGLLTVKERTLAENLRAQLAKGASFEKLAKQHSVGPASGRGGRLGNIKVTRLRGEFRRALQNLAPNQPSKIIPTEEGFTILMRFDRPVVAAAPTEKKPVRPSEPMAPAKLEPRPPASGPPQLAARTEVMAALEFMASGHNDIARVHLERARKKNPAEDSAIFLLGVIDQQAAGKAKHKAVQTLAKGFVAMTDGEVETALKDFSQARKLDHRLWQAQLLEANLVAGTGDLSRAHSMLEQVLLVKSDSARAHLSLGRLDMEQNQPARAVKNLRIALELEPNLAEAHYHLAALALADDDLAQGEAELKKTLELNPYWEEPLLDLGTVYASTNRYDLAEQAYRKALDLNPAMAVAHVNLGRLYMLQGEINRGIEELQKALLINPNMASAHYNLSAAYIVQEDWPKAILHADRALELGYPIPEKHLEVLKPHRR